MRRLKALAALVPVVLIVVGAILISGGGSGRSRATSTAAARFTPVGKRPRAKDTTIPSGPGTLVAEVLDRTTMRVGPDGRALATIGARTQFGSPDVLAVVKISSGWLGVISELAGNGRLGWIPMSATVLGRDAYELKASLSARTLTVLELGKVRAKFTVGIGAQDAPTPTGRFAVTDRLVTGDPGGPYGCCIVALSATAPHAIPGWTGGNRIAIHATPDTETIGEPDSHGCLHVTQAEAHWLVYHIPLGTQAVIAGS